MDADLWSLYGLMFRSRLFEEAITRLWNDGLISGEMHLGTGEEAIDAGIVAQLRDGDAMALDHRNTPALLMRGVDAVAILRELLGRPSGLCGGLGGHMHLASRQHLAAASGIVGGTGPAGVGFALAAKTLRPGTLAVSFFGEGAMNQGMLLESMNLASAWKLPALFVCKDDGWSITAASAEMTGGDLAERARGLGLETAEVDGLDVEAVWAAAEVAMSGIRAGGKPVFLRARCTHLEGHFLGFQLLRAVREPLKEAGSIAVPLAGSLLRPGGGSLAERVSGLREVLARMRAALADPARGEAGDPVARVRARLTDVARRESVERDVERAVASAVAEALEEHAP
jgi:TPP-dependent pyruvate/acetoin dehydrogenase alpha subunit